MSFATYPRWFEAIAANPCVDLFDTPCESSRQYISNVLNINSPFDKFRVASQPCVSSASDYFWRNDFSNITALQATCPQEYTKSVNQFSECENHSSQSHWTNSTLPNITPDSPGYTCKIVNSSENTKIWRPFSPSPSKLNESHVPEAKMSTEKKKTHRNSFNTFHTISSSRVKIEPSKSSVFKPFKRKSYNCTHCSMTYLSSVQLISHMRVHIGCKPYRCEYQNCFKTFSRNEELTRHRRIHSGYKPHLCTICGKTFGRKDHLSKHLKTHLQVSEKKIYVCCIPECGHRYTRSDALTRHKSTAHSIPKPRQRINTKSK